MAPEAKERFEDQFLKDHKRPPVDRHYLSRLGRFSEILRDGVLVGAKRDLAARAAFDSWIYLAENGLETEANQIRDHYSKREEQPVSSNI